MKITLQNVKRKFSQWRLAKINNKEKIPEELLKLVSACVFMYGKGTTASALNLSGSKLKAAMDKYPAENNEPRAKKAKPYVDKNFSDLEFFEAELKASDAELISSGVNVTSKLKFTPILYELENKFGVRLRVFSESEHMRLRIFSAFSLGG